MRDFYSINRALRGANESIPSVPEKLTRGLIDQEALIWIPKNLSRNDLRNKFPTTNILENELVRTELLDRGQWIRTSIANEPPFLELSAKELEYITRKMRTTVFSLELYLHVQWFCKQVFGTYIDKEYWTWLPRTRFDRSGLLIGGIDKLGQFDFHGWMPDFQASFCGGRYYYSETVSKAMSLVALEWEYDKRETSFKHWTSKLNKGDQESAFAAYHLLRDLELMNLYLEIFRDQKEDPPDDLLALHRKWTEQFELQEKTHMYKLAREQVDYYHAMLNDLVGYIIAGMKLDRGFVPYRIHNGLKNLRNYYLVINRLKEEEPDLANLRTKVVSIIKKVIKLAGESHNDELARDIEFYFGHLDLESQ